MSNPLIRDSENYVVLEPSQKEKFLSDKETIKWLEQWLITLDELPLDLKEQPSIKEAAKRLLDTACELELKPGFTIQWFAIRLEKPPD